ncbi:hypothetical protein ACFWG0_23425, partial [Streptomyces yangpuensis]
AAPAPAAPAPAVGRGGGLGPPGPLTARPAARTALRALPAQDAAPPGADGSGSQAPPAGERPGRDADGAGAGA